MIRRRKRMMESLSLDLEDHIRRETEDNMDRGMAPDDARNAALRAFGNIARIQEDVRDVWTFAWADHLLQDLRYTLRILRKNPGFTTVAVLTLALGIGMNTAVFSVVHAVLLQPLPYPNPDRLTWISQDCPLSSGDCMVARTDYLMYREQSHSFEGMALMSNDDYAVVYRSDASTERVGSIEGDFWRITNSKPALGRLFGPDDTNAAVLTWGLFQRKFGADPRVVGGPITIEGHTFTIAGVLPDTFRNLFPQANWAGDEMREIDAYIPTTIGHELPGDPVKPLRFRAPAHRGSASLVSFDLAFPLRRRCPRCGRSANAYLPSIQTPTVIVTRIGCYLKHLTSGLSAIRVRHCWFCSALSDSYC
jgi:hypothetical protein